MHDPSQEPLNPWRVYAESFILHVIGELSGERERRLRQVDDATLRRGERWRDVFEAEFSVTFSLIDGIRADWQRRREANPTMSPDDFVREIASEAFPGIVN
jgi:hypothetical protein